MAMSEWFGVLLSQAGSQVLYIICYLREFTKSDRAYADANALAQILGKPPKASSLSRLGKLPRAYPQTYPTHSGIKLQTPTNRPIPNASVQSGGNAQR